MKLNCLIIDDEPIARMGIEEHLRGTDFLNCAGSCESVEKATAILTEEKIDLIYLDIQMPKLNGIDFLRMLKNPPLTIITTAYSDYAVEGYSLDVIDYLMKPVTFDKFLRASQKAWEIIQLRSRANKTSSEQSEYFFVRCDRRFEKVFFRDVEYVEGLQNYAIIHLADKKLITYITLSSLENQLPKEQFLKVHKSYLISMPHVKAIEGDEIILEHARIPISRILRDQVTQHILGNRLFKR